VVASVALCSTLVAAPAGADDVLRRSDYDAAACADRSYADAAGDEWAVVDVIGARFVFDCQFAIWSVVLEFAHPVPPAAKLHLDFDTVPGATPANAADAWLRVALDDGSVIEAGRWIDGRRAPASWFGLTTRLSSRRVALQFTYDSIGAPRSFRWHGRTVLGRANDDFAAPGERWAPAPPVPGYTDRGTTGGSVLHFAPEVDFPRDADYVLAGDWNGDGLDDLLFYGYGARTDTTMLRRSAGHFAPIDSPAIGGTYFNHVVGDFNGDGRDDVFLFGPRRAPDRLLLGQPDGRFVRGWEVDITGGYTNVAAADFDADGADDLFFYGYGVLPDRVFLADGAAEAFMVGPSITVNGRFGDVLGGDFTGDGRGDVVFWGFPGDPHGMLLGRSGGFAVGPRPALPDMLWARAVGDYDGDAIDDVIQYGRGPNDDAAFHGSASGDFLPAIDPVRFTAPYTRFVAGDFDGDGRDDILAFGTGELPDRTWFGQP
jgi:hypothetical protein